MRVKAIRDSFEACPPAIAAFGSAQSKTHVSIGQEYEVYAISVFQAAVFLQIINDAEIIDWKPAWFFDVCDETIPGDWICSLPGSDLQIVLGPEFMAADESSYQRMVELNSESVAAFWSRLESTEMDNG